MSHTFIMSTQAWGLYSNYRNDKRHCLKGVEEGSECKDSPAGSVSEVIRQTVLRGVGSDLRKLRGGAKACEFTWKVTSNKEPFKGM
jgi:hypothetical protein